MRAFDQGHGTPERGAPAADMPTGLGQLCPAERQVLWWFRSWVLGGGPEGRLRLRAAQRSVEDQLGADAERFLGLLAETVACLRAHARNAIPVHAPCCPCVGPHEAAMLTLISAHQYEQAGLAAAFGRWLVEEDGRARLSEAVAAMAEMLFWHGLMLTCRLPDYGGSPSGLTPRPGAH